MLRFTDGEQFDLDGKMRLEKRYDGWYVVGGHMLIPVKDQFEGEQYIKERSVKNGI
jgi:hypothetical protein